MINGPPSVDGKHRSAGTKLPGRRMTPTAKPGSEWLMNGWLWRDLLRRPQP